MPQKKKNQAKAGKQAAKQKRQNEFSRRRKQAARDRRPAATGARCKLSPVCAPYCMALCKPELAEGVRIPTAPFLPSRSYTTKAATSVTIGTAGLACVTLAPHKMIVNDNAGFYLSKTTVVGSSLMGDANFTPGYVNSQYQAAMFIVGNRYRLVAAGIRASYGGKATDAGGAVWAYASPFNGNAGVLSIDGIQMDGDAHRTSFGPNKTYRANYYPYNDAWDEYRTWDDKIDSMHCVVLIIRGTAGELVDIDVTASFELIIAGTTAPLAGDYPSDAQGTVLPPDEDGVGQVRAAVESIVNDPNHHPAAETAEILAEYIGRAQAAAEPVDFDPVTVATGMAAGALGLTGGRIMQIAAHAGAGMARYGIHHGRHHIEAGLP
jgi:hypothetical protein